LKALLPARRRKDKKFLESHLVMLDLFMNISGVAEFPVGKVGGEIPRQVVEGDEWLRTS
jgi:hypothetical protein